MKNTIMSMLLVFCGLTAHAEGGKFLSLKLNNMQGIAIEYGIQNFGIGLGQTSYSTTGTDSNGPYTFSMTVTTIRGAYYFGGFGQDGWYGAGLLGSVPIRASQIITGNTYTATAAGSYAGASGGYQWYWGGFHLGAGLGFFSINTPSTKIYDAAGNLINTLASGSYSQGNLDLTIGYTF